MTLLTTAANHPFASFSIISLLLAFISSKFRQIVLFGLSNLSSIFIRRSYVHRSLGDAVIIDLMQKNYKIKRLGGELYGEDTAFIRSENEVKHILYRDFHNNTQVFYGKGWPVIVSGQPIAQLKDNMIKNYSYVIYTFRWSVDIVKLLDSATENKNVNKDDEEEVSQFFVKRVSGGRFFKEAQNGGALAKENGTVISEMDLADPFSAFIPLKWEKDNIGQLIYFNSLEMMSLNPELEDVLEEIKFWIESQEWYEDRGVPWKRGYLFYGRPGTGKTLFSRALAEHLNIPLIVFDLASMDNTEFIEAWNQIASRRIVLFEDFDNIFHKRKNIVNSDLTFDVILNCLDGADKKQGILTIITTNYPELLDPALGGANDDEELVSGRKMPSRPGRIDRTVEFLPLDRPGRMKLAMRILKDETLAEKMVEAGINDSAAQLQERCFRTAIDLLFKQRKAVEDAKRKENI